MTDRLNKLNQANSENYESRFKVRMRERIFVDSGSFLKWGGYSEAKQLNPGGTGCPRIKLSGREKMIQGNLFITEEAT